MWALSGGDRVYFNPHSLAGATLAWLLNGHNDIISIHAPSRERPVLACVCFYAAEISIHAPSRERLLTCLCELFQTTFQSTLPHGSDRTWLTTSTLPSNFNPRSLTGATPLLLLVKLMLRLFQSTLPHGSDRWRWRARSQNASFQSTLPHGSDPNDKYLVFCDCISIHAPSRERQSFNCYEPIIAKISIHAPSRERQNLLTKKLSNQRISIHAPSRERLPARYSFGGAFIFQSTLPHGSDINALNEGISLAISIHAPSRERRNTSKQRSVEINFNPRSLAGATKQRQRPLQPSVRFQSTLPRGSDLTAAN